jgi:hypothetical protein
MVFYCINKLIIMLIYIYNAKYTFLFLLKTRLLIMNEGAYFS